MSASREKKIRQNSAAQGPSEREQELQQKEKKTRRSTRVYGTIVAVVAVLAVLLLIWNSGLIQKHCPAVTVNGVSYSVPDVQYYYSTTLNSVANQYMNMFGMPPFDPSKPLDRQMFDEEKKISWRDHILDEVMKTITSDIALAEKAGAEGYKLSEDAAAEREDLIEEMNSGWAAKGYRSRSAFLSANFGPYMTYDHLIELLDRRMLAADYAMTHMEELRAAGYSEDQYADYYKEHTNDLDTFVLSQVTFRARVDTTDENGETVELTDKERDAAMEKAKAEAKANAEKFMDRLKNGEDFEKLITEFGDQVTGSYVKQPVKGAAVNDTYSEWAYDAARKSGDVNLSEYSTDSNYICYVSRFESRSLDESATATVHHILIPAAESGKDPTDEEYRTAKSEADTILGLWKAGGATEQSFADLAKDQSADKGSAANGGLIANISADSSYIPEFKDWALDPSRKPGDTGVVKNTGSSIKGWHIMYYVESGAPIWKQTAQASLLDGEFTEWKDAITDGYTAEQRFGIRFIK